MFVLLFFICVLLCTAAALNHHPVIAKFGTQRSGLTVYVLSQEEMIKKNYPVKGECVSLMTPVGSQVNTVLPFCLSLHLYVLTSFFFFFIPQECQALKNSCAQTVLTAWLTAALCLDWTVKWWDSLSYKLNSHLPHLVRWKCTIIYYEYYKYASGKNVLVLSGRSCPSEHTACCIKKIFLLQLDINIYYLFDLLFYSILFCSIHILKAFSQITDYYFNLKHIYFIS